MAAPTGPPSAKPTTPPQAAPIRPFSAFACLRFSGHSGAQVFPFQPRAVLVALLLLLRLQFVQAAKRLLR